MISLPRRSSALLSLAIALAACDQPTAPGFASVAGLRANVSKDASISSRILISADGIATFEVRTGIWNASASVGAYDGYFTHIQYKVRDERDKMLLDRNIEIKKGMTSMYSEIITFCKTVNDDAEKTDHGLEWRRGSVVDQSKPQKEPCEMPFKANYTVEVKGWVKGFGGIVKETAEARDNAIILGPTDLAVTPVRMVIPGPPPFLADPGLVQVGTAQTFDVQFSNNASVGTTAIVSTCEVHVFSGATDVTPAGLTFTWLPNGQAPIGATVPGSAVSAPLEIPAGNVASCRFTMTMPTTGTYRVEVTANAVSPADANLTNNKTTGTIQVVTGTPVTPPPSDGGVGKNATADDHAFFGPAFVMYGTFSRFTEFLGDSAQRANIENLSSTIITNGGLQGTFTMSVNFYTLDTLGGSLANPLATRTLSKATWTGSLPGIVAASASAPLHCVSSDVIGGMTVSEAANGNHLEALMCIEPSTGNQLNIGLTLKWRPPSEPPVFVSAAAGAQYYGDVLYWDTDLKFSNLTQNPVSHALVPLSYLAFPGAQCPGGASGAFACVVRSK